MTTNTQTTQNTLNKTTLGLSLVAQSYCLINDYPVSYVPEVDLREYSATVRVFPEQFSVIAHNADPVEVAEFIKGLIRAYNGMDCQVVSYRVDPHDHWAGAVRVSLVLVPVSSLVKG